MRRRAILHIGTGKTGSTTIQAVLAANREALIGQGFAYPVAPGQRNHIRLSVHVADPVTAERMLRAGGDAGAVDVVLRRLEAELAAELRALPDRVHSVIFSNEHLSTKVDSPAAAERLRALLAPHFDAWRIVVYLRRQDDYAVSLYSTLLRSGSGEDDILAPLWAPDQRARLDWAAMLDLWGGVFGREALCPRIFSRDAFVGGDLLTDFRAVCGLDPLPVAAEAVRNPSNLPAAQELLRRLNLAARGGARAGGGEATAPDGLGEDVPQARKAPTVVRHVLDSSFAGPGRRPSRAQALAFMAPFAAANERLRAEFFPDRPSLFGTDFSHYPTAPDPLPDDRAVLDVALAVLLANREERDDNAADVAYRRGRARQAADDPFEARRLYHRALAKSAGHPGALRGLVELATEPELMREAAARLRHAIARAPERTELTGVLARLERRIAAARPADIAAPPDRRPLRLTPEERAGRRAARGHRAAPG